MPSFDVTSEIDWQEVDNARNQSIKETIQRFDFKGVQCTVDVDDKKKEIVLSASKEEKIKAFGEVFREKLAKRGLSLLAFTFENSEPAASGGGRIRIAVQAGIDTDKAKQIVKAIKDRKFKAQAQIQGEQVRVTAKKRDELQDVITFLKEKQSDFKVPMQFTNYRD